MRLKRTIETHTHTHKRFLPEDIRNKRKFKPRLEMLTGHQGSTLSDRRKSREGGN